MILLNAINRGIQKIACVGVTVLALSSSLSATAGDLRLKFAGTLPADSQGTKMMKQIDDLERQNKSLQGELQQRDVSISPQPFVLLIKSYPGSNTELPRLLI